MGKKDLYLFIRNDCKLEPQKKQSVLTSDVLSLFFHFNNSNGGGG